MVDEVLAEQISAAARSGHSAREIISLMNVPRWKVVRVLRDRGLPVTTGNSHASPNGPVSTTSTFSVATPPPADPVSDAPISQPPPAGRPRTSASREAQQRRRGRPVRYPQLADPGWLRREYEHNGRPSREIAHQLGCSSRAVTYWLRKHGIATRGGRPPEVDNPDWLRRRYVNELLSTRDIAKMLSCSNETVRSALERHGIPTRAPRTQFPLLCYPDRLRPLLRDAATVTDAARRVADHVGCSPTTAENALRQHGLTSELKPPGGRSRYPQLNDPQWLTDQHVHRGRSPADIAEQIGCSSQSVRNWLRKHGITGNRTDTTSTDGTDDVDGNAA